MPPRNEACLVRNNFDLLRLLFAVTVCLVHSHELSGFRELQPVAALLSSAVAVKAFFVVSGFLIFMSYERSSSLRSYAVKRIRRIYPAYFAVVMLCALGMAAVSSNSIGDYFSSGWLRYVAANLAFLNFVQPTLPGVFDTNRLATVNGALWTLKIEVMFYASVPLFVSLSRRLSRLAVLALAYCASVAYATVLARLAEQTGSNTYAELGRQLPGQLSYFMAGAFFYYFLPLFERNTGYFLAAAAAVLIAGRYTPLPLFEPFALATVVIFFGLFRYAGNFGKYGDFSYGFYILHFPIIQLLVHSGRFAGHPSLFLGAVIALTTIAAIAMWHLIEKKFLPRSSHYLAAAGPEQKAGGQLTNSHGNTGV